MFQEVVDFREESEALYELLSGLDDGDFNTPTQFKSWTFNDIIGHLHFWNHAALLSLENESALMELLGGILKAFPTGGLRAFEDEWLGGLGGIALREQWRGFYLQMADSFSTVDPKTRVKWAGPDMSVRSSITARLMETWAHGQAIYDALGVDRVDTDRIKGIAVLGINTFGWTFKNRGLAVPEKPPHVRLTAPSGSVWEWNDLNQTDSIEGSAQAFCQVVTQTRHISDTDLQVSGSIATRWMQIAQCFAGPPEQPPEPGSRSCSTS